MEEVYHVSSDVSSEDDIASVIDLVSSEPNSDSLYPGKFGSESSGVTIPHFAMDTWCYYRVHER